MTETVKTKALVHVRDLEPVAAAIIQASVSEGGSVDESRGSGMSSPVLRPELVVLWWKLVETRDLIASLLSSENGSRIPNVLFERRRRLVLFHSRKQLHVSTSAV